MALKVKRALRVLGNRTSSTIALPSALVLTRAGLLFAYVIFNVPTANGSSASITSEAAIHGHYGLRVALDSTGCELGDTAVVASQHVTGAERFEGCAAVFVEDVVVASSGRIVIYGGASIAIANGFRVEEGGAAAVGIDSSLFGDAYLEKEMQSVVADEVAVRFYVDLDHAEISENDSFDVFSAISKDGRDTFQAGLTFNASLDENRLFVRALTDGGSVRTTKSSEVLVEPGPHYIDLVWRPASAVLSGNGSLQIWLDGVEQVGLESLQNSTLDVKTFRLGVMGLGSESRGHIDFDSFLIRRAGPIGPVQ